MADRAVSDKSPSRDDADRRARRIAALSRMIEQPDPGRSVHEMARTARADLVAGGTRPDTVVLDSALLVRPHPETAAPWGHGKGRDKQGPVPGLRAVGGTRTPALQVLLLAILEAQCRRRRRVSGKSAIPVVPADGAVGELSWARLVAVPPTASLHRWRGGYQRENRLRQIKKALDRLETLGRVSLGPTGHSGRYEEFVLNREYEDGAEREPYRRPPESRGLELPVELWTNGWVHVLTDAELLLYLSLRHHAGFVVPGPLEAQRVLSREQRERYGISKDNYEDLRELAFFGLIQLISDENRNLRDGTVRDFKLRGRGLFHRVAVHPDGLRVDAGPRVLEALRHLHNLI